MQASNHQTAREHEAAASALIALARLMGRLAAQEHLIVSDQTGEETHDADQQLGHEDAR